MLYPNNSSAHRVKVPNIATLQRQKAAKDFNWITNLVLLCLEWSERTMKESRKQAGEEEGAVLETSSVAAASGSAQRL